MSAAKCQLNEAEKKLLKEKQDRGITVVGIDLAARVSTQYALLQVNISTTLFCRVFTAPQD